MNLSVRSIPYVLFHLLVAGIITETRVLAQTGEKDGAPTKSQTIAFLNDKFSQYVDWSDNTFELRLRVTSDGKLVREAVLALMQRTWNAHRNQWNDTEFWDVLVEYRKEVVSVTLSDLDPSKVTTNESGSEIVLKTTNEKPLVSTRLWSMPATGPTKPLRGMEFNKRPDSPEKQESTFVFSLRKAQNATIFAEQAERIKAALTHLIELSGGHKELF